jgi:energy-converting hydrogenase Eha subunit A
MVKRVALIFLFLLNALLFGQDIRVKASTDTTSYKVGDYINYTLRIEYDKNIGIIPPLIKDSLKVADIIKLDTAVTTEENGRIVTIIKAVLSKYDSAVVNIPPIAIKYRTLKSPGEKLSANDSTLKTILSYPVTVLVHTLQVNPQAEIKDVKDPVKVPLNWLLILMWVAIAAVVLGAAILGWLRYKKNKANKVIAAPKIILPAHVVALTALNELEKKQLWQKGMVKEYHSEITEIIRAYFERKFDLRALELTTTEVNLQLKEKSGAANIIDLTNDFLNNADLVKFAKFKPENSVNEEMMKQALEIVNLTANYVAQEVTNA